MFDSNYALAVGQLKFVTSALTGGVTGPRCQIIQQQFPKLSFSFYSDFHCKEEPADELPLYNASSVALKKG